MMIRGVNHITLSVNDIEESFRFYVETLGCKPIQKNPRSAYLVAGDTWIALDKTQYDQAAPAADYTHIALTVDTDSFAAIKDRLRAADIEAWSENTTEGESYYFLDPNGHKLELAISNLENRIADAKEHWDLGDQITWYV